MGENPLIAVKKQLGESEEETRDHPSIEFGRKKIVGKIN